MTSDETRLFIGKPLKWWRQFFLGYLVMVPLFLLGFYLAVVWGFGLGLGMFAGAGLAMSPVFIYIYWTERKKKK
jgi:hypothetical protein